MTPSRRTRRTLQRHAAARTATASARVLVRASALSYAANCALGTAVAVRLIDTSRIRWVHHALYILTTAATALTVATGLARDRRRSLALAPALFPLAIIPFAGTHTARHPLISLSAAPFFVAGVLADRR